MIPTALVKESSVIAYLNANIEHSYNKQPKALSFLLEQSLLLAKWLVDQ
jgi:hypothetical protein